MTTLVGIVNVTPDSFSDGGVCASPEDALAQIRTLAEAGAAVIDVGAESTRPGAMPLSYTQEWERLAGLLPEARAITSDLGVALSLDTRHAETASRALEIGADWINDVSGFTAPAMVAAVRDASCRLVLMHARGIPADPRDTLPEDADPVAVVRDFFRRQLAMLEAEGVARERVVLDPGLGFGKTHAQSLALVLRAGELCEEGCELLVGHSRKSFLGLFSDAPAGQRDDLTLAFSAMLAAQGVEYLRVHAVCRHRVLLDTISAKMPQG